MWTYHWDPGEAAKSRTEDVLSVVALHFECQVPGTGREEAVRQRIRKGGKASQVSDVSMATLEGLGDLPHSDR